MPDIGPRLEARIFISGFRAPWNIPVEYFKLVTTFRPSTPGSAWSMAKDSLYRIRPVIPLGIGDSGYDIRKMRHIANLKSVHVKVNQLPSGDVHAFDDTMSGVRSLSHEIGSGITTLQFLLRAVT